MSAYDPFMDEEDLLNDRYRCEHGNFIGNPIGGDFMCGLCEMGVSLDELELAQLVEDNRDRREAVALVYIEAIGRLGEPPAGPAVQYAVPIMLSLWRSRR